MQTDYWKSMEVQPSFERWLSFYQGCVHCACDHGCNEWLAEQAKRTMLLMRIMNSKGDTSLDRVVQMPLKKVNQIVYKLSMWDCVKFNKELRAEEAKEKDGK